MALGPSTTPSDATRRKAPRARGEGGRPRKERSVNPPQDSFAPLPCASRSREIDFLAKDFRRRKVWFLVPPSGRARNHSNEWKSFARFSAAISCWFCCRLCHIIRATPRVGGGVAATPPNCKRASNLLPGPSMWQTCQVANLTMGECVSSTPPPTPRVGGGVTAVPPNHEGVSNSPWSPIVWQTCQVANLTLGGVLRATSHCPSWWRGRRHPSQPQGGVLLTVVFYHVAQVGVLHVTFQLQGGAPQGGEASPTGELQGGCPSRRRGQPNGRSVLDFGHGAGPCRASHCSLSASLSSSSRASWVLYSGNCASSLHSILEFSRTVVRHVGLTNTTSNSPYPSCVLRVLC